MEPDLSIHTHPLAHPHDPHRITRSGWLRAAVLGANDGIVSIASLIARNISSVIAFFFSLIPLVGTLTGSTIIVLVCLIPGLGSPATALTDSP